MSNLQQFVFNSQSVRVISVNGDPWFVATDICEILEVRNVSQALSRLDDDEKNTIILNDGNRGNPNTAIISESGLYSLTLGSRKPQAKDFKRWVTHEILPTIRKTGKYEVEQKPIAPALPQDFEEAVVALLAQILEKKVLAEANQKLLQEKQVLQTEVKALAPQANLYQIYVSSDGWLTGEQIAKQLSVSPRKMFDVLRTEKVIFSRSGRNLPCQKWVDQKWATMREVKCRDDVMRFNLVFSYKSIMQIFDILQAKELIPANSDYQTHLEFDAPKPMKRANLVAV